MHFENGDKKSRALTVALEVFFFIVVTFVSFRLLNDIFNWLTVVPDWPNDVMVMLGWILFFVELALAPAIGYIFCGPLADMLLRMIWKK